MVNETLTWQRACATGHRRLPDDVWDWVAGELNRTAVRLRDLFDCRVGVSGMALGVDLDWFDAVCGAGLEPWACAPYPQQPDPWKPAEQARWQLAWTRAARRKFVGDLADVPPKQRKTKANELLYARNDEMLRISQVVVAVYDPRRNERSGTHDTFLKATGQRGVGPFGKGPCYVWPVVHIDPQHRRTRMLTSHLPVDQRLAIEGVLHRASSLA